MHLTAGLYIILFSLSALTAASRPAAGSPGFPPSPLAAVFPAGNSGTAPFPADTAPKEKDFPRQSFFIIRPIPVLAANKP